MKLILTFITNPLKTMKEKFLQFIWNFQLFQNSNLQTTDGQKILVQKAGVWNRENSGPDFVESWIYIQKTLWVGNVEIHVKSSDWNLHHHSTDMAYSTIILHVLFENDENIEFLKERKIPTLELKNYIPQNILINYENLHHDNRIFIPCEKNSHWVEKETIKFWLERLFVERLERKVEELENQFIAQQKNWEQVLFQKLAYSFGLKINAEAFEIWSKSFEFKILSKIQSNPQKIHALFFGQAGFLAFESEDDYIKGLQNDYNFLKTKYQLDPIETSLFKFFRLRPPAFPTVRLAQLAILYSEYQNLFGFLMGSKSLTQIKTIFSELTLPKFWENHYTLDKISPKKSDKKLSNEMIEKIIINTIVPIKFAYAKSLGKDISEDLIEWLREIPPEKNKIIREFSKLGWKPKNAFESQALLQLKKYYCDEKNCLNCPIGLEILKYV